MGKNFLLVTNNNKAGEAYREHAHIQVEYLEGQGYLQVLLRSRDLVHRGWRLMSHPQASNLKPNQSPYKTILLSQGRQAQPQAREVELIEAAISAYDKFTRGMTPPTWSGRALADFQTVDLAVVESAINSSLLQHMMLNDL